MSQQVRLEGPVYERINSKKRSDESFSEALERLTSGHSLRDLREAFDEGQVSEMREAIDAVDDANAVARR